MAVVNFPITIVDADIARVQAATRALFGDSLTDEQIIETLRQELVQRITAIVKTHERQEAVRLAQEALLDAHDLNPVVGVS